MLFPSFVAAFFLLGQIQIPDTRPLPLGAAEQNLLRAVTNGDLASATSAARKINDVNVVDTNGKTVLMLAVEKGQKDIVNLLLDKHATVYVKRRDGGTAISDALEKKDDAILQALLTRGENLGFIPYDKTIPLLAWVSLANDPKSVQILLELGVDPHSDEALLALGMAAAYGNVQPVSLLLAHGVDPNASVKSAEPPLVMAAMSPNPDQAKIVQMLLKAGADANKQNGTSAMGVTKGTTALMAAAYSGNTKVVLLLLDAGAKLDTVDSTGKNAVAYAEEGQRMNVAAYLKKLASAPAGSVASRSLFAAVDSGDVANVRAALKPGTVDSHDADGLTPLMHAAMRGDIAVMKFLLQAGAKPDLQDLQNGRNYSAMMWAAEKNQPAAIRLLASHHVNPNLIGFNHDTALTRSVYTSVETVRAVLDAGADVNQPGNLKETALMSAAGYGKGEMIRLLLERGAQIDARNEHGNTALWWAINNDFPDVAILLLERGASVNTRGDQGQTPLFLAIQHDRTPLVSRLLAQKANVNLADSDGTTPLMVAVQRGNIAVVRTLLAKGADVSKRDRFGIHPNKTALGYAQKRGDKAIIALLKRAGAKL